jgi:hypothetical protein
MKQREVRVLYEDRRQRAAGAPRSAQAPRPGLVITCENVNVRSSCVYGQVHCAGGPQLHDAARPRAHPSRDDAQPDGDDGRRRDGEPRLSDDAPARDASVLVPSQRSSIFL